jgi:hypothetical protein
VNNATFLSRLVRNWPAKVLSIAAAVILVVFYNISRLEDRFFTVPLEVSVADELIPASAYPETVRIRLRGEPDTIERIREDDVRAVVDFTEHATAGEYVEPVQIRKTGSALESEPVEIRVEPTQIEIRLAERARKSVEVEPTIQGFAPTGYRLSQYQVSPSTVEVEGPRELVEEVEIVRTEEIELAGRRDDFTVRVRLEQPDNLLRFPGGRIVEFSGIVEETVVLRTIEPVEVVLLDLDPDLRLVSELPTGSIRVQGRQIDLEDVTPSQVQIVLDAAGITEAGSYTLEARPSVPQGLVILRYEPRQVELEVAPANAQ